MIGLYIATEDPLSEAVANRLIEAENKGMHVAVSMGRKGNGYLRSNLTSLTKIARSVPVLLLTDLDRVECPAILIENWCRVQDLPTMMLFRVAVHETEAWLLSDREGFAEFSGVPLHRIPLNPESLSDPKDFLINLVRRFGRRDIKADIVPERGSTAKVGFAYNQALCNFTHRAWSLDRASQTADSLNRARRRIHELRLRLEQGQQKTDTK